MLLKVIFYNSIESLLYFPCNKYVSIAHPKESEKKTPRFDERMKKRRNLV